MLRNQYIIVPQNLSLNSKIVGEEKNIWDFRVIYDNNLPCTISERILLIGYILDPLIPALSNEDIIKELNIYSSDSNSLIKSLQKYSGRYVLLFKSETEFICLSDAFGLRQLYYSHYNDSLILSSSPQLILDFLGWEAEIPEKILTLLSNNDYKLNESPWLGNYWYDRRIKKILPNHYLDINKYTVQRTPLFINPLTENEIKEYILKIFEGSFQAIGLRYSKIIQPVTAGWDSRLLLAASKKMSDKIQYYLFLNSPDELHNSDVITAIHLASKLDINFEIISTTKLTKDFLHKYYKISIFPRVLPKTSNIQYHYYKHSHESVVNINGNGGEIIRRVYYYFEKKDGKVEISTLLKCRVYNSFFEPEIREWYEETVPFAEKYNINLLDLFYWEERMGHWHALYQYEQDIAIEEFSPFNNKNLILSILQIDPEKRIKNNCILCKDIMSTLWPEVLSEPINTIYGLNLKEKSGSLFKEEA